MVPISGLKVRSSIAISGNASPDRIVEGAEANCLLFSCSLIFSLLVLANKLSSV